MTSAGQRPQLTERQRAILNYIEREVRTTGVPPSIRQIGVALGISSTNGVRAHLQALEKKGYIHRSSRTSRGIASLDRLRRRASKALHDVVEVPILGRVTAGQPILAVENREGSLHLDPDLVKGTETFALRIEGDSMIGAGIHDGDYVLVRPQQSANNGEIVVALLDDSVTVKRFYRETNGFRLQPENPRLEPIYVPDVHICGKVVSLIRPNVH
ncbi:MAG: transcriptional repressor LexA [Candidatus Tectomicrobia bacterium]|uniref:LexA repressor n=1 Tax=Tectimicrobiota bacterium TaxID=2528274 RepID=A0A937VZW4_UNCTE|nr:transcriptional repressor LexA [Candidatus Tectomicrobia bacterium]